MYKIDENATLNSIKDRLMEIRDSANKCSNLAEMVEITTDLKELVDDYAYLSEIIELEDPIIFIKCTLLNDMFESVAKYISIRTMELYLEGLEG